MSRWHPENPIARFERQFSKTPGGCWLWFGNTTHNGYGSTSPVSGESRAHRISWAVYVGAIPKGLQVLHRCDVRNCVNPDHLFLGTNKLNRSDMVEKGRAAKGERAGLAKLKESDVIAIRSRRSAGEKLAALAAEYGMAKSTICQIAKRQCWRHL